MGWIEAKEKPKIKVTENTLKNDMTFPKRQWSSIRKQKDESLENVVAPMKTGHKPSIKESTGISYRDKMLGLHKQIKGKYISEKELPCTRSTNPENQQNAMLLDLFPIMQDQRSHPNAAITSNNDVHSQNTIANVRNHKAFTPPPVVDIICDTAIKSGLPPPKLNYKLALGNAPSPVKNCHNKKNNCKNVSINSIISLDGIKFISPGQKERDFIKNRFGFNEESASYNHASIPSIQDNVYTNNTQEKSLNRDDVIVNETGNEILNKSLVENTSSETKILNDDSTTKSSNTNTITTTTSSSTIDTGSKVCEKSISENDDTAMIPPEILNNISIVLTNLNASLDESINKNLPDETSMKPREYGVGIVNLGNTCFLASVMQALVASPMFVEALKVVDSLCEIYPTQFFKACPVAFSVTRLAMLLSTTNTTKNSNNNSNNNYNNKDSKKKKKKKKKGAETPSNLTSISYSNEKESKLLIDAALRHLLKTLTQFNPDYGSFRQQDAQESLLFVLDLIHVEVQGFHSIYHKNDIGKVEEEEWFEKKSGKKKVTKSVITTVQREKSFITDIFHGELRSEFKAHRAQEKSITFEPFITMPLDIMDPKVNSVYDCLKNYCTPEIINSGSSNDRSAHRHCIFQILPKTLIFYIKRFTYNPTAGSQEKVTKFIRYHHSLELSAMCEGQVARQSPRYELGSFIVHHGLHATNGHYVTYRRFSRAKEVYFLKFDDAQVTRVSSKEAMRQQAYLLIYNRA